MLLRESPGGAERGRFDTPSRSPKGLEKVHRARRSLGGQSRKRLERRIKGRCLETGGPDPEGPPTQIGPTAKGRTMRSAETATNPSLLVKTRTKGLRPSPPCPRRASLRATATSRRRQRII